MLFRKKSEPVDQRDWVDEASDTIEGFIDKIRDTAVVPLSTAVRGIVYGLLIVILGFAALVLFAILAVRILDIYLDNIPGFPEDVWVAHFLVGAIFMAIGAFCWSKRSAKSADHEG